MKAKRSSREFPHLTTLSRIQLELWQIIALTQQKQAEVDSGKCAFNAGHPAENLLQRPVPPGDGESVITCLRRVALSAASSGPVVSDIRRLHGRASAR